MDGSFVEMRAASRGGPEVLESVQVPLRNPGKGEARVRVEASGVLLADVMWQRGAAPGSPKPPFVPGYDLVGHVDEIGDGVEGVALGDRVAAMVQYGGYAEYAYVEPEKLVLIPESVDAAEVVCLTVGYLTALQLLTRVAQLAEGQRVLVHGAGGGTGSALVDVAAVLGLEVFGTASVGKHDFVRELGGTPIDYRTDDFVTRVLEMTDGQGVDLVVDPIGGSNLARSFRTLRRRGLVVATAVMSQVLGGTSSIRTIGGFLGLYLREPVAKRQERHGVRPRSFQQQTPRGLSNGSGTPCRSARYGKAATSSGETLGPRASAPGPGTAPRAKGARKDRSPSSHRPPVTSCLDRREGQSSFTFSLNM